MQTMVFNPADSAGQVPERSAVPETYRWRLDDLYPSIAAWKAHKTESAAQIEALTQYQGRLVESAATLLAALRAYFETWKALNRLHSYAHQLGDENLQIAAHQELVQEAQSLNTMFGEKSAFFTPELTAADEQMLHAYLAATPELAEFRMFLQEIQRKRAHILSEAEEKLLAGISDVTGSVEQVFSIFHDAEFPFPEVTLSTGETVRLTQSNYTKYRNSPVQSDRRQIFQAFLGAHATFKNTFGANLVTTLKSDYFYAKSRKYGSCLEAALNEQNIPVAVYDNLILQIRQKLPTLHRFLHLKRRRLGLDVLHYSDLYASIVQAVDLKYTIEEGQRILRDAFQPLGASYADRVCYGFAQRWIDYMPMAGKRSGAYSNGSAYDVHPYILMNWTGNYESLSTLAHELGHTMHSDLTNAAQPFATAGYSIFVAEIASTLNENLLNDYLIRQADTPEVKLFLLDHYLEGLRCTVFRQVLFADFEWQIHKKIEAGEPLTGESLSQLYLDVTRTYYGHDQGVCLVDPEIRYEWAFIAHFYFNFYVFQYATSLIYATAFAEKILRGETGAVEKYLGLLRGGSSNYPIDLIREAGIEPLSSEAFDLTMQRMNQVLDQIDDLTQG